MTSWTRTQKFIVSATLVYAGVFLFVLVFRPGSRHFYDAFFNSYQVLPPLFCGVAGLFYQKGGRHTNRARRFGWLLIALAGLSFALGQCTWTYLESIKGLLVPFPSWADAGYLGTYPLLIAGVLFLFGSMPVAGRLRQLLDGSIAASSLGILSWFFVVQQVWEQSDIPVVGKCISMAYPLGDIAALFGAMVLLANARHSRKLKRSLCFLATGILGFTFFDTSFTWMSLHGTYRTGSWSDWTLSFGWILIGYSFLLMLWPQGEFTNLYQVDDPLDVRVQDMWQIIVPYAAALISCLVILVYDYAHDRSLDVFSMSAGTLLMTLVVGRQILALVENRSLTLKLKSFNSDLEKLVAERTRELERRNQTILAMVEERNRFYRHVSHEVRTPLTSIIGFAEILAEDEDKPLIPSQQAVLQKVISSAHRLLGMINGLLDISRIEAGKMELDCTAISINDLIEQVVDDIMPLVGEKGLGISVSLDRTPTVFSDREKLTQVLINLLSNAVKYTERGGVSVSASTCGEKVTIKISDTGVGIPEDELNNIFREFYRVQVGPVQRGSGLGLAIVRQYTELLGGTISVKSKLYQGSTFTLSVPIASPHAWEKKRLSVVLTDAS